MIIFIIITGIINYLFWDDLSMLEKEIKMEMSIKSMNLEHLQNAFQDIINPILNRIKFMKGLIIAIIILFIILFFFFLFQYMYAPKIKMLFI